MTRSQSRRPADTLQRNGLPTLETLTRRIVRTYLRATPSDVERGLEWYADAGRHAATLGAILGSSDSHGAAILSHLSPRTPWARNVAGAYALASTGSAPGCLRRNVAGALRARDAADPLATLKGAKTSAFARNILGDSEAVTIDVWAARVALGDVAELDGILARVGVYDALAHAYRLAARRLGVAPAHAQAVTWIVARNGRSS